MIGNTIEFWLPRESALSEPLIGFGKVVDAFTNITGRVDGKVEAILGIGGGKVSGQTISKRMYLVEYSKYRYLNHKDNDWKKEIGGEKYITIDISQFIQIVNVTQNNNQELHEEKFINRSGE